MVIKAHDKHAEFCLNWQIFVFVVSVYFVHFQ